MFINDVGQDTWEEINDGIAGSNYGWNTSEGPTCESRNFDRRCFAYGHGISATTDARSRAALFTIQPPFSFPQSFFGKYFFADLCSWLDSEFSIRSTGTASDFASSISSPVDLKVSA